MAKRVLSVGQCGADNWSISRTLEKAFAVEVVPAATSREALDRLRQESFALVLVNRIFDVDGASGLDLIRHVKADNELAATPIILVSNYADAQQQAVAAGAAPGFGKAALGSPEMQNRLRVFLD
jgi:two-component system chemotaxis response regulator CheY